MQNVVMQRRQSCLMTFKHKSDNLNFHTSYDGLPERQIFQHDCEYGLPYEVLSVIRNYLSQRVRIKHETLRHAAEL